jgi:hypothetical protein
LRTFDLEFMGRSYESTKQWVNSETHNLTILGVSFGSLGILAITI